jgi:hypothetical protein
MKLRIILVIAGLFLAGCWYTTFPQDNNPDCRKQTYGFLLLSTSSTSCEQSSPTPTALSTPSLVPRTGG